MKFELDRTDIKNLLKGVTCPPYEIMEELEKRKLGYFTSGFVGKWTWNLDNTNEPDQDLFELYLRLKKK